MRALDESKGLEGAEKEKGFSLCRLDGVVRRRRKKKKTTSSSSSLRHRCIILRLPLALPRTRIDLFCPQMLSMGIHLISQLESKVNKRRDMR